MPLPNSLKVAEWVVDGVVKIPGDTPMISNLNFRRVLPGMCAGGAKT
jgi:hypothetical protein